MLREQLMRNSSFSKSVVSEVFDRPHSLDGEAEDPAGDEHLVVSLLDDDSMSVVSSHKIDFFGREFSASVIFDDELLPKMRISYVLNFNYTCDDDEIDFLQTKFYVNQILSNVFMSYHSPDEFVQAYASSEAMQQLQHVIFGAPGYGKTKFLDVLKRSLRKSVPTYWIGKLSYGACLKQLKELSNKMLFPDAYEIIKSALDLNNMDLMVLKAMAKKERCIFIIDDYDLLETTNQRVASELLKLKKVILSSGRKNISVPCEEEFFHLESLKGPAKNSFVAKLAKSSEQDEANLIGRLEGIKKDFDDSSPLYLMMASQVLSYAICPQELLLQDLNLKYCKMCMPSVNTIQRDRLKFILYDFSYNFILGETEDDGSEGKREAARKTSLMCVMDGSSIEPLPSSC